MDPAAGPQRAGGWDLREGSGLPLDRSLSTKRPLSPLLANVDLHINEVALGAKTDARGEPATQRQTFFANKRRNGRSGLSCAPTYLYVPTGQPPRPLSSNSGAALKKNGDPTSRPRRDIHCRIRRRCNRPYGCWLMMTRVKTSQTEMNINPMAISFREIF